MLVEMDKKSETTFVLPLKKKHVFIHSAKYFRPKTGFKSEIKAYNDYHQVPRNKVVNMHVKSYLKEVSKEHPQVTLDDRIVSGMPVINGTRVQISVLLACLRDGMSPEEICEEYDLSSESLKASLNYLIDVLNKPFHSE